MDKEKQKAVAIFRFGVISDFVNGGKLNHGKQERLLKEKCARKWEIPGSAKTRISRSTVLRWIALYENSGGNLVSLYPKNRTDRGKNRTMDDETALALIELRDEMADSPVRILLEEMVNRELVSPGVHLSRSTVYRFLNQNGLMERNRAVPEDRRRFEAELPNDIWQSDVMHGPMVEVDGKQRKSYLIALMDDHSRLVVHGEFFLSENLKCFLEAFEAALLSRGLPRKLYVDNGAAFRAKQLEYITASLGVALIHARPYKPQGKGKIERFFRTVRSDFLTCFKGGTLNDINLSFYNWLNDLYHMRKHGGTGQKPFERFTAQMECLRPAPANIRDHFRKVNRRRVGRDRTITLDGKLYEAPVSLIGKRVDLLYHESNRENVEIAIGEKSYGMAVPVDLHVNCKVRRDKNNELESQSAGKRSDYRGGKLFSRGNREDS